MSSRKVPKPANWCGLNDALSQCKDLYQTGQFQEAEAVLCDLLELASAEPKVWAWLGQVRLRLGKEQAAHEALDRARKLLARQTSWQREPASMALATLLWQQGAHDEARQMLSAIIRQQGATPSLLAQQREWESD